MNFKYFPKLKMRSKAVLIIALVFLLLASGFIFTLYEAGIIKFKADVVTKNVTVTGTFTEAQPMPGPPGTPLIYAPVPNAKIIIGAGNRTPAQVTTKSDGSYRAVLTINAADSSQRTIYIKQDNPGYPEEGNIITQVVRDINTASETLNQNIQLSKIPVDRPSSKILDAISMKCRDDKYNLGDYYGEYVEGILFCAPLDQKDHYFIDLKNHILKNATQIKYLEIQTGLTFNPYKVILSKEINWTKPSSAGYFEPDLEIILSDEALTTDVGTITHEFGHLVDWERGADITNIGEKGIPSFKLCHPKADSSNMKHCYSSAFTDFYNSYYINLQRVSDGTPKVTFITGYATKDEKEMFAEYFRAIFDPGKSNDFRQRDEFKYYLLNSQLNQQSDHYFSFAASSLYLYRPDIMGQNAAIYIYKFVANISQTDEYFPGTVARYSETTIGSGKYMKVGLVPVRVLDHTNKSMENTVIKIDNKLDKTIETVKKYEFPNGDFNSIDDNGTVTLMNVPPGINKIVDIPNPPDYYKGAVYHPVKKDIVQGANPLIDLTYFTPPIQVYYTNGAVNIPTSGTISFITPPAMIFSNATRVAKPIVTGQMTRYPTFGTTSANFRVPAEQPKFAIGGDFSLGFKATFSGLGGSTTNTPDLVCPKPPNTSPRFDITPNKNCTCTKNKIICGLITR